MADVLLHPLKLAQRRGVAEKKESQALYDSPSLRENPAAWSPDESCIGVVKVKRFESGVHVSTKNKYRS